MFEKIGEGGNSIVYARGDKVYKVLKKGLLINFRHLSYERTYKYLIDNIKGFSVPKTKFTKIENSEIGKVKIIQNKIDGEPLSFENLDKIDKVDFENLIKSFLDFREKKFFDIDFTGLEGLNAFKNNGSPVLENLLVDEDGKMNLVDIGYVNFNGGYPNNYNLIELSKSKGIDKELITKLELWGNNLILGEKTTNKILEIIDYVKSLILSKLK